MAYNGIHGATGGIQGHHYSGPANAGRIEHGHYGRHAVAAQHSPRQQHWPPRAAGLPNRLLHARKAIRLLGNNPGYLHRNNALKAPKHQAHQRPVGHAPAFPRKGYPLPGLSPYAQKNVWSGFKAHSAPVNPHTQYFNPAHKQQAPGAGNWQRPAPVKHYPQAHVAPEPKVKLHDQQGAAGKSHSEPTYSSIEDLDLKPVVAENPVPAKKKGKSLRSRFIAVFRKNKSPSKGDLQVARNLKQGVNGPRASHTYVPSKSVAAKKEQPSEEPIYAKVDKQKKLRDREVRQLQEPLYDRLPPKIPEGDYQALVPRAPQEEPIYESLKPVNGSEEEHIYDSISSKGKPEHEQLKHRPLPPIPPDQHIYEELTFGTEEQSRPAGQDIYDTPRKGAGKLGDPIYDTPTNNKRAPEENIYDTPKSNGKVPDSDIYDVPRSQPRERSDSVVSLGAVSTASTDSGISEASDFSELSELESALDDTSSLSSVDIDLDELDQMEPVVTKPKPSKKAFKKLLEKKKKAAKALYKEQLSYDKSVKVYLNTLKRADEAFQKGDKKGGNNLINQAFNELEKVRAKTDAIQEKVGEALADIREIEESSGSSELPEWVETYGSKAAGQLSLNSAVQKHYESYLGTPLQPLETYGKRVIDLGKHFTGQFLLFTGRVK